MLTSEIDVARELATAKLGPGATVTYRHGEWVAERVLLRPSRRGVDSVTRRVSSADLKTMIWALEEWT